MKAETVAVVERQEILLVDMFESLLLFYKLL